MFVPHAYQTITNVAKHWCCGPSFIKLDQLDQWIKDQFKTRTIITPAFWGYPLLPHDYPYYWVVLDPKSKDKVKITNLKNLPELKFFEFWHKLYTRHICCSCLIRCANMKWIRWVLLKIQSGHDSVHRRTDGRTDGQTDGKGETSIPPFQLRWSGGIITLLSTIFPSPIQLGDHTTYHNFFNWLGEMVDNRNMLSLFQPDPTPGAYLAPCHQPL